MTDKQLITILFALVGSALAIGGYLIYVQNGYGWIIVGATLVVAFRGMRSTR